MTEPVTALVGGFISSNRFNQDKKEVDRISVVTSDGRGGSSQSKKKKFLYLADVMENIKEYKCRLHTTGGYTADLFEMKAADVMNAHIPCLLNGGITVRYRTEGGSWGSMLVFWEPESTTTIAAVKESIKQHVDELSKKSPPPFNPDEVCYFAQIMELSKGSKWVKLEDVEKIELHGTLEVLAVKKEGACERTGAALPVLGK
eukprot:GHVU01116051.1.p1 GENE.GHVU01116051.1~~GHVU01116051.1.p1  ORF type:complete len:202 (+),score=38.65 GHVU01116051.1:1569-2174(+)